MRPYEPGSTGEIFITGKHAGVDRSAVAAAVAQQVVPRPGAKPRDPAKTSEIIICGKHAGIDKTRIVKDPFEPQTPDPRTAASYGFSPSQQNASSLIASEERFAETTFQSDGVTEEIELQGSAQAVGG